MPAEATTLPLALSPAYSVNKVFPSCFLTLNHCAGFKPGAADEVWGSLVTCHQGKLLAVTSGCATASLHHLPAALHAWIGLQGLMISYRWLPIDHKEA